MALLAGRPASMTEHDSATLHDFYGDNEEPPLVHATRHTIQFTLRLCCSSSRFLCSCQKAYAINVELESLEKKLEVLVREINAKTSENTDPRGSVRVAYVTCVRMGSPWAVHSYVTQYSDFLPLPTRSTKAMRNSYNGTPGEVIR